MVGMSRLSTAQSVTLQIIQEYVRSMAAWVSVLTIARLLYDATTSSLMYFFPSKATPAGAVLWSTPVQTSFTNAKNPNP